MIAKVVLFFNPSFLECMFEGGAKYITKSQVRHSHNYWR